MKVKIIFSVILTLVFAGLWYWPRLSFEYEMSKLLSGKEDYYKWKSVIEDHKPELDYLFIYMCRNINSENSELSLNARIILEEMIGERSHMHYYYGVTMREVRRMFRDSYTKYAASRTIHESSMHTYFLSLILESESEDKAQSSHRKM